MPDHIYIFTDASTKAYGTVVYLQCENEVSLAMSKCVWLIQALEDRQPASVTTEEAVALDDNHTGIMAVLDTSQYSSFHQLQAVTALVLRAIHNFRKLHAQKFGPLTSLRVVCCY